MLKIAVCDDEAAFLVQIREHLERRNQTTSSRERLAISCFSDGDELIRAHEQQKFDILLLDIIMPLANGIEIAREIRLIDKKVKIVFLTSSREFAVESYGVKASNYLLKPVEYAALELCLAELTRELLDKVRTIPVKSAGVIHQVALEEIEYVEAQNKQMMIYLHTGKVIASLEPLYELEKRLPLLDGFFKCSRSYIVNIWWVSTFTQKEITMQSGCRIPISRSNKKEFEKAYFSLLFGKEGPE